MPSANPLTALILLAISERFSGRIVAWRNNRIDAMAPGRNGKMRRVQAGINGQADITGIMPDGRRLEIEVKAGRDKKSDVQEAFQRMVIEHCGVYILARDVEGCMKQLEFESERRRIMCF